MATKAKAPLCNAVENINGTVYKCTLPEGHENAHENAEFEVAWANNSAPSE